MRRALLIASLVIASSAIAAEAFDARFAAAVARSESGDHAGAEAAFEALAREFPARPEPLNNLATELARRGDLVHAREALERALRTHPAYATAHDNLRTVYAALASDAYRKALPVGSEPIAAPELALIARAGPEPVRAADPVSATVVVAAAPAVAPSATPSPVAAATPRVAVPTRPTGGEDPAVAALNSLAFGAFSAVDAWARAWASKDVSGYLAAYGATFAPPGGLSRAAWETQRGDRIRAPKQIAVSLAQRDLTIAADRVHATMRFVQTYRSDRFNGSAWKTLELARERDRWLIVAERAGR